MEKETLLRYYDKNNNIMALLIKNEFESEGINFLTPDDAYMQVASMKHDDQHVIIPHYHNRIPRNIDYTCEAIVMKKGRLKVYLYDNLELKYEFIINKGDILILYSGGHGFKCIGQVSMVEIKQGPFVGAEDKTRFNGGIN